MIALWLALTTSASAVDLTRFPLAAPVDLPDEGPARIVVPPELRSLDDRGDGSDLLLADGRGRAVPVAALTGPPTWEASPPLPLQPADTPHTWTVDVGARPVDALRVELPNTPLAATVTVFDERGAAVSEPTRIWRLSGGEHSLVPMEPSDGRLTLRVEPHGNARTAPPSVRALLQRSPGVDPDRLRVPVSGWIVQENGWVRYDIVLPHSVPVAAIHLDPIETIFQRDAGVMPTPLEAAPALWSHDPFPSETTRVERIQLGHVDVQQARVPVPEPADRLSLLVEARGLPPLSITEVELEVPGLHLLVEEPGPGPHTLYGGAPVGSSPVWDLSVAAPELVRGARALVRPGPVRDHTDWIPPEVRYELADPGPEVDSRDFSTRRPVQGEGLVRVLLPHEVLTSVRSDLGDLRLLTDDERQVPYLLRRAGEQPYQDLVVQRTEHGSESRFTIELPHPDVPLASVHLRTPSTLFERRVTLSRVGSTGLVPLRTVRWHAADRPTTLGIVLEQRVGDRLVVTIDNGDDKPLPVDDIELRWPSWELLTRLPDEPVSLYYGDPRRAPPSYDLALLDLSLRRRAAELATLGEPEALGGSSLSSLDRTLVAGGLAVLVLGLLGLLLALVRATAEDPDAEAPAPDAP